MTWPEEQRKFSGNKPTPIQKAIVAAVLLEAAIAVVIIIHSIVTMGG